MARNANLEKTACAAAATNSDKSEDETPKKPKKKRDKTPPVKGKGQLAVALPLNHQGSNLA